MKLFLATMDVYGEVERRLVELPGIPRIGDTVIGSDGNPRTVEQVVWSVINQMVEVRIV